MDAVKFLKEKHRMTKQCNISCKDCPLASENNGLNVSCTLLEVECTEKAVEIVNKWSEEHPQKTYLQDFIEKFPRYELSKKGIPRICRDTLYTNMRNCSGTKCVDCWNEPMEDK